MQVTLVFEGESKSQLLQIRPDQFKFEKKMNAASSNYQQIVIANNQQNLLLTSANSAHSNKQNLESTPQVQSRISKQARSPSGAIQASAQSKVAQQQYYSSGSGNNSLGLTQQQMNFQVAPNHQSNMNALQMSNQQKGDKINNNLNTSNLMQNSNQIQQIAKGNYIPQPQQINLSHSIVQFQDSATKKGQYKSGSHQPQPGNKTIQIHSFQPVGGPTGMHGSTTSNDMVQTTTQQNSKAINLSPAAFKPQYQGGGLPLTIGITSPAQQLQTQHHNMEAKPKNQFLQSKQVVKVTTTHSSNVRDSQQPTHLTSGQGNFQNNKAVANNQLKKKSNYVRNAGSKKGGSTGAGALGNQNMHGCEMQKSVESCLNQHPDDDHTAASSLVVSFSKKKGGFERLNLTTNLKGISNLLQSPTTIAAAATSTTAANAISLSQAVADEDQLQPALISYHRLDQSNDFTANNQAPSQKKTGSYAMGRRQSQEDRYEQQQQQNQQFASVTNSALGLNLKLQGNPKKGSQPRTKAGKSSVHAQNPTEGPSFGQVGQKSGDRRSKDILSLMKADYTNHQLTMSTQQRVPVSTRNQASSSTKGGLAHGTRKPETTKSIKFDNQMLVRAAQTPVRGGPDEIGAGRRLSLANAKIQGMKGGQPAFNQQIGPTNSNNNGGSNNTRQKASRSRERNATGTIKLHMADDQQVKNTNALGYHQEQQQPNVNLHIVGDINQTFAKITAQHPISTKVSKSSKNQTSKNSHLIRQSQEPPHISSSQYPNAQPSSGVHNIVQPVFGSSGGQQSTTNKRAEQMGVGVRPQHGVNSATNKVKKTFNFDIVNQSSSNAMDESQLHQLQSRKTQLMYQVLQNQVNAQKQKQQQQNPKSGKSNNANGIVSGVQQYSDKTQMKGVSTHTPHAVANHNSNLINQNRMQEPIVHTHAKYFESTGGQQPIPGGSQVRDGSKQNANTTTTFLNNPPNTVSQNPPNTQNQNQNATGAVKIAGAGGTTAITTQGGNTVININIGNHHPTQQNMNNLLRDGTPKTTQAKRPKPQLNEQTMAIFNRLLVKQHKQQNPTQASSSNNPGMTNNANTSAMIGSQQSSHRGVKPSLQQQLMGYNGSNPNGNGSTQNQDHLHQSAQQPGGSHKQNDLLGNQSSPRGSTDKQAMFPSTTTHQNGPQQLLLLNPTSTHAANIALPQEIKSTTNRVGLQNLNQNINNQNAMRYDRAPNIQADCNQPVNNYQVMPQTTSTQQQQQQLHQNNNVYQMGVKTGNNHSNSQNQAVNQSQPQYNNTTTQNTQSSVGNEEGAGSALMFHKRISSEEQNANPQNRHKPQQQQYQQHKLTANLPNKPQLNNMIKIETNSQSELAQVNQTQFQNTQHLNQRHNNAETTSKTAQQQVQQSNSSGQQIEEIISQQDSGPQPSNQSFHPQSNWQGASPPIIGGNRPHTLAAHQQESEAPPISESDQECAAQTPLQSQIVQKTPIQQLPSQPQANAIPVNLMQPPQQQLQKLNEVGIKNKVNAEEKQKMEEDEEDVFPMKVRQCLKKYARTGRITDYEKMELLDYQEVWFIGTPDCQKIAGGKSKANTYNLGYDDEQGDYNVRIGDHLGYRFEIISFLGKGSFGQALRCHDHKTGEIVAVKIIRNKQKFKHQAQVELNILLHLRQNDPDDVNNIIQIKDHCEFRNHLLLSFELFSINLYEFIKHNNFQGVSLCLIRRFAIQILQALRYMSLERIIHCDLKPENILLKSQDKSGLKIIDFGSSCFSDQKIYTYIQSRFYRAPEIILGVPYTTAIDMWSFACILVELYTGIPIFPGESEHEQLSLIMQVIGCPDLNLLERSTRRGNFFEDDSNQLAYDIEDSTGQIRLPATRPLLEIIGLESQSFLEFICSILVWDPEERLDPTEALQHPWITEGLPPQVLIHHKRMLGLEVPSICESEPAGVEGLENEGEGLDDISEIQQEFPFQQTSQYQHSSQINLMAAESMERPSYNLPETASGQESPTEEPKLAQTQPLSQQIRQAKPTSFNSNNSKNQQQLTQDKHGLRLGGGILQGPGGEGSKTTNMTAVLQQINSSGMAGNVKQANQLQQQKFNLPTNSGGGVSTTNATSGKNNLHLQFNNYM